MPSGANPATYNYTGTYSYMILPDDGSGTAVSSPIRSFVNSPVDQPVIGPVPSTNVPLSVPTSGTGGSNTNDDITTSTITINNSNYINANVTGMTVNLTLDHQRDGDLTITLTAPERRHHDSLFQAGRHRPEFHQYDVFGSRQRSRSWEVRHRTAMAPTCRSILWLTSMGARLTAPIRSQSTTASRTTRALSLAGRSRSTHPRRHSWLRVEPRWTRTPTARPMRTR